MNDLDRIKLLINKDELYQQLRTEITNATTLNSIVENFNDSGTREQFIKNIFLFYNEEIPVSEIFSDKDFDMVDSMVAKYLKNPNLKKKKLWKLYNIKVYTHGNKKILYKGESNINTEVQNIFDSLPVYIIEKNDDGDDICSQVEIKGINNDTKIGNIFLNINDTLPLMISSEFISYYSDLLNNPNSNFSEFLEELSKRTIHY